MYSVLIRPVVALVTLPIVAATIAQAVTRGRLRRIWTRDSNGRVISHWERDGA